LVDFSVRLATQSDFLLIEGLVRQTRLNPARLDWQRFVVAFSTDGDFMGCGQVKSHGRNLLELASIAVRKRYRKLGVAGAMIGYLLSLHPRPVYLMCRSGLGPFYEKFGFSTLSLDDMPKYFQRASQVMGGLEVLQQMRETLIVMRAE
jgi:N-acetylglutamate synthase-like GNAT family acetyltransferase